MLAKVCQIGLAAEDMKGIWYINQAYELWWQSRTETAIYHLHYSSNILKHLMISQHGAFISKPKAHTKTKSTCTKLIKTKSCLSHAIMQTLWNIPSRHSVYFSRFVDQSPCPGAHHHFSVTWNKCAEIRTFLCRIHQGRKIVIIRSTFLWSLA
jgi:hypothetical protein